MDAGATSSLLPSSTYRARVDLLGELIKLYPEALGELPSFFTEADNAKFQKDNFINYMHNVFLIAKFGKQHTSIFEKKCRDLLKGKNGCKGDAEDKIIAGLLNPNITERLTMEEAQKKLNALV